MTTATISSPAERYLEAVQKGLSDLADDDVEEVLQDLAAHIAELGDTDPETALGSPETFIAEFRASAGLDGGNRRATRVRRWIAKADAAYDRTKRRVSRFLEPLTKPITRRRHELRIAWIWSRGILGLSAYWWISHEWLYGDQRWLFGSRLVTRLSAVAVVTGISVWLADQRGKWWRRTDTAATVTIMAMILVAMVIPRYVTSPEEIYNASFEQPGDAMLFGPNGPIQNIYAYDLAGNPVQVLLYDDYGNPVLTLPADVYDTSAWRGADEPFFWGDYMIQFATDVYGRPIGNLYPLDRYHLTETGTESTPPPPPVVGIPQIPEAGASGGSTQD